MVKKQISRHYPYKLTPKQLSNLRKKQYAEIAYRDTKKHGAALSQVNSFKGQMDRLRRDAQADTWTINGAHYNRQDIIYKVLDWITEGNSLKMFCEQVGAPSIGTIYKWFKNHPEFERDYRLAEEAAAHIMSDKALLEVVHLTEREDVPVVKLRYDALTRRAAQMSQKFQDKQVFRQEEDIKSVSDDELRRRRDELFTKVKEELIDTGWTPPAHEVEVQTLEEKTEETDENTE